MKRSFLLAGLLACQIFSVPGAMAADATWPWAFAGIDYGVQTAPNVDVRLVKEIDFDVYHFVRDGHFILNAYVGNYPDFPSLSSCKMSSNDHHSINGLVAKTVIYKAPACAMSRETLVTLKHEPRQWIQYIHFYYNLDSRSDAVAADAIIGSLEYFGLDQEPLSFSATAQPPSLFGASPFSAQTSRDLKLPVATTQMKGSDFLAVQRACQIFAGDTGMNCGSASMHDIRITVYSVQKNMRIMFQSLNPKRDIARLHRLTIIYTLDSSLRLLRRAYPS